MPLFYFAYPGLAGLAFNLPGKSIKNTQLCYFSTNPRPIFTEADTEIHEQRCTIMVGQLSLITHVPV